MATMRDVAALAHVSAKTVSRVFNGDPHVSVETKQRVDAALEQLQYVPNDIATTFRNGRSAVIGVAVPDVTDPFFAQIAKAAEVLARQRGMTVVITSIGDDPAREVDVVRALLGQALSGLVIAPVSSDHRYLSAWAGRMPVVFVDRRPVNLAADFFVEDDVDGAHLATSHLAGHGHRLIGYIGDEVSVPTAEDRLRGYRAALADAGLESPDDLVVLGPVDRSTAEGALDRLDDAERRPTALFCSNARSATGLVPYVRSRGLALATFGDFPLADQVDPSWTFVDQDPERLGTLAAHRILDRIERPRARQRRRNVLNVSLVERASCRITTRLDEDRSGTVAAVG